jgi:myo-inositol catabolism protein IolC
MAQQSIQAFTTELHQDFDEFERFWLARNAETPDAFPLAMESAEWQEQFLMWVETAP